MLELTQHHVIHLEVLAHRVVGQVIRRKVKEHIPIQQRVHKGIRLRRLDLFVRSDASAAVDRAAGVGQLHFLVGVVGRQRVGVIVVVVERNPVVFPLDQPSRGCVVVIGRQREAGVFREVVDRLHQAFAKGGFAHNQRPVMVLQSARNDLRGRSRVTVHQHDDREDMSAVAMRGRVHLVGISASALRNDRLPLGQQVVANLDRLTEQPAGITTQVKDQSLQVREVVDRFIHFPGRCLLELGEVNVADSGTNLVLQIHRGMRNLVPHQIERQRLALSFSDCRQRNMRALGSLQGLGNHIGSHAVGALALDRDNYVTWLDSGPKRRGVLIGFNHIDLVLLLLDDHAHTVIVATLVLLHPGVVLGIVEAGVRIEHPQHSRDGPVVDDRIRLVAVDRLGVVLLHQRVDIGEFLQVIAQLRLVDGRLGADLALQQGAYDRADAEEKNEREDGPAGAGSHGLGNLQTLPARSPAVSRTEPKSREEPGLVAKRRRSSLDRKYSIVLVGRAGRLGG